jgi:hypothetical protein
MRYISANNTGSTLLPLAGTIGVKLLNWILNDTAHDSFVGGIQSVILHWHPLNFTQTAANQAARIGELVMNGIKGKYPDIFYAMAMAWTTQLAPLALQNDVQVIIEGETQTDPSEPPAPGLFYVVWTIQDETEEIVYDVGGITGDPEAEWCRFADDVCTVDGGSHKDEISAALGQTLGRYITDQITLALNGKEEAFSGLDWHEALVRIGHLSRSPVASPYEAVINRHA